MHFVALVPNCGAEWGNFEVLQKIEYQVKVNLKQNNAIRAMFQGNLGPKNRFMCFKSQNFDLKRSKNLKICQKNPRGAQCGSQTKSTLWGGSHKARKI